MNATTRIAALGVVLLLAALRSPAAESIDVTSIPPPADLKILPRQLRLDLVWQDPGIAMNYEVQRALKPSGPFKTLPVEFSTVPIYSDFIGSPGGNYYYRVRAVFPVETNQPPLVSHWSEVRGGRPEKLDEEKLLTEVEEGGFRYFYDYAHPVSGLARVGTRRISDLCSSGSTGWGLYHLVLGIQRGFITRPEGARRAVKTLRFLDETADRFHGAFPHWLNGATGKVVPFSKYDDGADIVETAYLMEGVLLVREYFSGNDPAEAEIRQRADALWRAVEWDWFVQERAGRSSLIWHWSPTHGWFKNQPITGFNECQAVYLLALASPTHPIPAKCYWEGWESHHYATPRTVFGIPLELGRDLGPPLFWTEYSYLGFDPRQMSFHGKTYYEHFQNFCRVQILYAQSKAAEFKGYGPLWGLTAGYGPEEKYHACAPGPHDKGTITPSAALSSMPYVPEESKAFLLVLYQQYGRQLWGPFGFYDGLNPSLNWMAHDYLANNVGPIAPMIENYRSGLCWQTFMKAPEIAPVLKFLAEPPPPKAGPSGI